MNTAIKNIRESLGLSQAKMSEIIGIGRTRYMKYEKAERRVSPEIAYKILDLANSHGIEASLEDIYPRTDESDCKHEWVA